MNFLSDAQSLEFAAILDGYEETLATANAGKTDTLDDIRTVLRSAGLKGSELADELASFREAVAERRLIRTNPEKAERKAKKRDGATDYLFVLTDSPSCTHERRRIVTDLTVSDPITTVEELEAALELPPGAIADRVTPHNPDTGEIEAFAALSELVESITVLDRHGNEASATVADRDAETVPPAAGGSPTPAAPVDDDADLYQRAVAIVVEGQKASTAYVQRLLGIGYNKAVGLMERMEAEGIISRSDVGGRRTVLKSIEQNPKPGVGVESMGNGGQAEPAETMLEPNLGYAAGRTAEEDIASPEGGRPSPLPVQVHRTIGGEPLKPAIDYSDVDAVTRQRQADTPDIPSFLKRANTGQAGRA